MSRQVLLNPDAVRRFNSEKARIERKELEGQGKTQMWYVYADRQQRVEEEFGNIGAEKLLILAKWVVIWMLGCASVFGIEAVTRWVYHGFRPRRD